MKSILAVLLLSLSSGFAVAEGGTGLTQPGDYYNPDVKCSVADGVTLYVTAASTLKVSVTSYDKRSNKVSSRYLAVKYAYNNAGSNIYQIEQLPEASNVAFLEIGHNLMRVLNAQGTLIVNCEASGVDGGISDGSP